MSELVEKRWRRGVHDRIYFKTPDGDIVGWIDLKTGREMLEDASRRLLFDAAANRWAADFPAVRPAAQHLPDPEPEPTEPEHVADPQPALEAPAPAPDHTFNADYVLQAYSDLEAQQAHSPAYVAHSYASDPSVPDAYVPNAYVPDMRTPAAPPSPAPVDDMAARPAPEPFVYAVDVNAGNTYSGQTYRPAPADDPAREPVHQPAADPYAVEVAPDAEATVAPAAQTADDDDYYDDYDPYGLNAYAPDAGAAAYDDRPHNYVPAPPVPPRLVRIAPDLPPPPPMAPPRPAAPQTLAEFAAQLAPATSAVDIAPKRRLSRPSAAPAPVPSAAAPIAPVAAAPPPAPPRPRLPVANLVPPPPAPQVAEPVAPLAAPVTRVSVPSPRAPLTGIVDIHPENDGMLRTVASRMLQFMRN